MEKVFINPVAREILMKGNAKEGPVDLFSYDGNGNGRTLGSLFLVGNIQGGEASGDDIDVGYVLNLVASLAKREYYSNPDLNPKEAFSNALKKINGVVEEFFKKKDTKINIGIFAIAAEQIHISKLGKFKVFLARDGKNIDILNNIQLFNKEIIEEKEFSNIISGKIHEGDRILAFYPNRSITAREKFLKEHLLGTDQEGFAAQLASLKESKPDFSCVALHIDVQKGTEAATAPRIQPRELQEEEPEEESVKPEPAPAASIQLAGEEEVEDPVVEEKEPEVVAKTISHQAPEPPMPKIIPSEFARAKREIKFAKHLRRLKHMNLPTTSGKRTYLFGGIAVVALLAIIGLKSFVFVNASSKQLNAVISEAQANLELAQDKINQSDFIGARGLLMSSLTSLTQTEASNGSNKKVEEAKAKVMAALDNLDQAKDANLTMVAEIPVETGDAKLITSLGNTFYTYLDQENSGSVAKITAGSVNGSTPVNGVAPKNMFSSEGYISLVDPDAKKIASISTNKSTVSVSTFSTDSLTNYQVYQDNLYGLTSSGIIKITDAALGHTTISQWFAADASLPAGASRLVVDGNIYVLSENGVLTTYYKGKKTAETNTAVAPESGSFLLTNTESPNLYLVNPSAGRVYTISKSTGSVSKTLKINANNIEHATLGLDDSVYLLSNNKIWRIQ